MTRWFFLSMKLKAPSIDFQEYPCMETLNTIAKLQFWEGRKRRGKKVKKMGTNYKKNLTKAWFFSRGTLIFPKPKMKPRPFTNMVKASSHIKPRFMKYSFLLIFWHHWIISSHFLMKALKYKFKMLPATWRIFNYHILPNKISNLCQQNYTTKDNWVITIPCPKL